MRCDAMRRVNLHRWEASNVCASLYVFVAFKIEIVAIARTCTAFFYQKFPFNRANTSRRIPYTDFNQKSVNPGALYKQSVLPFTPAAYISAILKNRLAQHKHWCAFSARAHKLWYSFKQICLPHKSCAEFLLYLYTCAATLIENETRFECI